MAKKIALLIIDGQFDFCDPRGSLYVSGAEEDMVRVGNFITKNEKKIDFIGLTMDSHQVNDISHPSFWVDKDGNFPNPFTAITHGDVLSGVWSARFAQNKLLRMLKNLKNKVNFLI